MIYKCERHSQTNERIGYEPSCSQEIPMNQFNKFTHEKTSSTKEGRLSHFHRLKGRHSHNSFILVGPYNHSYHGALAVEFQPLDFDPRKEEGVVIDCEDTHKASLSGKGATEGNNEELTKKSTFNGVIANAPLQRVTGEVIELSDSPSLEPPQDLLAELPQISVYNRDCKYYTPTFVVPNLAIKNADCLQSFQSKIEEARREIPAEQIMEPRPRNKHLYCGVCKQSFGEYLGHVKGQGHQDKSRRAPFAQHIKTLELQMNIGNSKKEREREWKKAKAKEERLRKKEEEDRKKQRQKEEEKKKPEEDGGTNEGQLKEKSKEKMEIQCKFQAKIEASDEDSQQSSSSSSPEKIIKKRKPRKPCSPSTKQQKSKQSRKRRKSSSNSTPEQRRSREKRPRKKQQAKEKKPTAMVLEEGKKKRGRPSKKDLELRRQKEFESLNKK